MDTIQKLGTSFTTTERTGAFMGLKGVKIRLKMWWVSSERFDH
jgi:hypothetical protein